MNYIEILSLAILQGIFEWLPVSSKTMVMLYSILFLGRSLEASYIMGLAVQGGTILASIVYFWRKLIDIMLFRDRKLTLFLIISTLSTCISGIPLYILFLKILKNIKIDTELIAIAIGFILLAQAIIARRLKPGLKNSKDISIRDSLVFGLVQGLATTPGVSRSGITITILLILGYRVDEALRLSFIASIPTSLGASILSLYIGENMYPFSIMEIVILFAISTIVGLTIIDLLIRIAKRYSYMLTALLGILTIVIAIIAMII